MYPLLTAAQMRLCDEYTINELGVPSQVLMERAAHAAIEVLYSEPAFEMTDKTRVVLLCGSGNNGGDGFAMARFLFEEGVNTLVCYAGEWQNGIPNTQEMSVECARQYTLWSSCGGKTSPALPAFLLESRPFPVVVVDALFGIGLAREIEGTAADWIREISLRGTPVLAIDVPSGVQADSGQILGCALHAAVTATIAEVKRGLLLYPAAEYVGKLRVCDIGISADSLLKIPDAQPWGGWYLTGPKDISYLFRRSPNSHKGTFGRVTVIGGSLGMCGAPYFAAKSAYRAGAGLVEICTIEDNRIPLQTLLPEAVLTLFSPDTPPTDEQLMRIFDRADSVVLGCGLGQSDASYHLVEATLRLCQKPLVLDADALNLIAADEHLQDLAKALSTPVVITPHMGEAARLSGRSIADLAADPFAAAKDLALKYNAVCVLKDARTVTSNGTLCWIQSHGNSGMATGGSGDCLAGLIGALYAKTRNQTITPGFCAAAGVFIHALAGDDAEARLGEHAVMASDIADGIGRVLRDI
jgi:NAD(P)H-hydrate epimerase